VDFYKALSKYLFFFLLFSLIFLSFFFFLYFKATVVKAVFIISDFLTANLVTKVAEVGGSLKKKRKLE
jgi:hypothetical protein